MLTWITQTATGKFISTLFISMLPIVELRAGLPYGIALGLEYPYALIAAVVGNLIPVPFIIVFIRKIFAWLRTLPRFEALVEKLESKAHLKGEKVIKYGPLGLWLLVAIPIPGTGAWMGSLVAVIMDIRMKRALPAIILGVITAAMIMTAVTYGVITVL